MSTRPRRDRPRQPRFRLVAWLVAGLLLLVVGIAIGEALHDNPQPGLTVTTTKTIVP
jgi:hypothetical protein